MARVNHPEFYPKLSEEFEKIRNGDIVPDDEEKDPYV